MKNIKIKTIERAYTSSRQAYRNVKIELKKTSIPMNLQDQTLISTCFCN